MKRRKVTKGPDGGEGEGNNAVETSRFRLTEAAAAAAATTGSELVDSHDASDSNSLPRVRTAAAAAAAAATTTHNASSTTAFSTSTLPNDNDEQEPTPLALQPTTEPIIVANVTENDVLLGRGATIINHVGNQRFHQLVLDRKQEYNSTWRHQIKDAIARKIFVFITEQRNGRFLRRIDSVYEAQALGIPHDWTTMWLVADPNVAIEKIKQALRDKHAKRSRAALAMDSDNPVDGPAVAGEAAPPPAQQQQQQQPGPPPQLPNVHAATRPMLATSSITAASLAADAVSTALPMLPAVASATLPGLYGYPLWTPPTMNALTSLAAADASPYNYLQSAPALLQQQPQQHALLMPPSYMGLLLPLYVPPTAATTFAAAPPLYGGIATTPPWQAEQLLQHQHDLLQQQQQVLLHQQLLQQQRDQLATAAAGVLPGDSGGVDLLTRELLQFLQSQAVATGASTPTTTTMATATNATTATTTSADSDGSGNRYATSSSTLSDNRQQLAPQPQPLENPRVPVLATVATTATRDPSSTEESSSSEDEDDQAETKKRARNS
jgi:hypothetical protein